MDNVDDTSFANSPFFSMSGDGVDDVDIPSVFLFSKEGSELIWSMRSHPDLVVYMGDARARHGLSGPEYALNFNTDQLRLVLGLDRHKSCRPLDLFILDRVRRHQCLAREFDELKSFYALFDHSIVVNDEENATTTAMEGIDDEEDKDGELIQITMIGDVIFIKSKPNGSSVLEIDVEAIENEVRQTPGQTTDAIEFDSSSSTYVAKVFDHVLSRFVKQTNFMTLSNTEKFSKTLFNYVSWSLRPATIRGALDSQDRVNLAELARLLKSAS